MPARQPIVDVTVVDKDADPRSNGREMPVPFTVGDLQAIAEFAGRAQMHASEAMAYIQVNAKLQAHIQYLSGIPNT